MLSRLPAEAVSPQRHLQVSPGSTPDCPSASVPAAPEGDTCHSAGRSRPSPDHRLQDHLGLMSSQLLTGPRAHSRLIPPRGSGPFPLRPQDLCCWLGLLPRGGQPPSPRGSRVHPALTTPHSTPTTTFYDRFVLQLPAARRRQVREPGWGVGTWQGSIRDLCHPPCCGSPWSAGIAHVWWVCVTSFQLMGCDSSRPHPLEQHSPS